MGFGSADRPSPLASQMAARMRDVDWTLAHFAFVADVTTLAAECDIAHSPAMSVASCRAQPELALAFLGESPELLATYATFLATPGSIVSLLVSDEQRQVVASAFEVESSEPAWQVVYRGDPRQLTTTVATELVENDLTAIQALAHATEFTLTTFTAPVVDQGPAYGVWARRRLVSMATTILALPGVAWIGNVVTREEQRRQGLARMVTEALVRSHLAQGRVVFAVVNQDNEAGLGLFNALGFVRERAMYAMRCVLH